MNHVLEIDYRLVGNSPEDCSFVYTVKLDGLDLVLTDKGQFTNLNLVKVILRLSDNLFEEGVEIKTGLAEPDKKALEELISYRKSNYQLTKFNQKLEEHLASTEKLYEDSRQISKERADLIGKMLRKRS